MVGSWANETIVKRNDSTNFGIDLAVEIPRILFEQKDYLNARFFHKQAFYLAVIAQAIISSFHLPTFYHSTSNDPRLTTIVLYPPQSTFSFFINYYSYNKLYQQRLSQTQCICSHTAHTAFSFSFPSPPSFSNPLKYSSLNLKPPAHSTIQHRSPQNTDSETHFTSYSCTQTSCSCFCRCTHLTQSLG